MGYNVLSRLSFYSETNVYIVRRHIFDYSNAFRPYKHGHFVRLYVSSTYVSLPVSFRRTLFPRFIKLRPTLFRIDNII